MAFKFAHGGKTCHSQNLLKRTPSRSLIRSKQSLRVKAAAVAEQGNRKIRGKCFITKDNIDTDQIIPAEYLTLVPSKPEEYEKLGSYALIGLPEELYPTRFVEPGKMKTEYPIIIGGNNFGCGSSREHAPVALGASGAKVVVAQSYARIFFRNCVATGELYPCETDLRMADELQTGALKPGDCCPGSAQGFRLFSDWLMWTITDPIVHKGQEVEVDMEKDTLTDVQSGKVYGLKPLGEAGPVIDAGGLFNYARQQGMIKTA